jgi:hypothetical protein
VAGEIQLDMRELVGCLIWAEEGRGSGSTVSRAAAADVQRRRGVSVRIGRGGEVGELCGARAELLVWSARAEVVGKGRATVSLRLAGVRWARWRSGLPERENGA